MSVEAIGQGIKENLKSITKLSAVYAPDETPSQINEFPCATIQHLGTEYQITMGDGNDRHDFRVYVFVTNQDQPSAFSSLLPFLEKTGSTSLYAALHSDRTLDGSAQDITVVTNSGQSVIQWAGIMYLGTAFDLEVYE